MKTIHNLLLGTPGGLAGEKCYPTNILLTNVYPQLHNHSVNL